MAPLTDPWPDTDEAVVSLQHRLADLAAGAVPFLPPSTCSVGGCFVAFARGEQGPGHPGDRAWAAAVSWRPDPGASDGHALLDEHVVADAVPASYAPGLLARREGPILAAAIGGLAHPPDVVLIDATGLDHPRRAGLALHVGAALDVPTVGVTHRGLVVRGDPPAHLAERGDREPVELDGTEVGAWVCTRSGARPVLVHAAWRTGVAPAVEIVLAASTERARTPVPLQEARRLARVTRAAQAG